MQRVAGLVVATVIVGVLGACSGGDPAPSASPTSLASEAPTSTPMPTETESVDEIGVSMDLSDPELGFELIDVPTDLEGDEADVYTALALYEREYWRALQESVVSPFFGEVASGAVVARLERLLDGNVASGTWYGGEFRATIDRVSVEGDTASASVCDDYRGAEFIDEAGAYEADEVGAEPTVRKTMELERGAGPGQWVVTSGAGEGPC